MYSFPAMKCHAVFRVLLKGEVGDMPTLACPKFKVGVNSDRDLVKDLYCIGSCSRCH